LGNITVSKRKAPRNGLFSSKGGKKGGGEGEMPCWRKKILRSQLGTGGDSLGNQLNEESKKGPNCEDGGTSPGGDRGPTVVGKGNPCLKKVGGTNRRRTVAKRLRKEGFFRECILQNRRKRKKMRQKILSEKKETACEEREDLVS